MRSGRHAAAVTGHHKLPQQVVLRLRFQSEGIGCKPKHGRPSGPSPLGPFAN
jgi:hypothetical protein